MGTGKTILAEKISFLLKMQFVDLDHLIEKKEGKKINLIFQEKGEDYFRDLETKVLKSFSGKHNKVISCGGGIVIREKNREILKEIGLVFLVQTQTSKIIERLEKDETRPLLQGTKQEKLIKINNLLKSRQNLYLESADFVVENNGGIEELTKKIIDLWKFRN